MTVFILETQVIYHRNLSVEFKGSVREDMEGLELTSYETCYRHFENQCGNVLELNTHFP